MIHCKLCGAACLLKKEIRVGEKTIERYQCQYCLLPDTEDPIFSQEYSLYYVQLLNGKLFTEEIMFPQGSTIYGIVNDYIPMYGMPETYISVMEIRDKRLIGSSETYSSIINLDNVSIDVLLGKIKTILTFQ